MKIRQNLFASRLYYSICCFVLFFAAASAAFHGYYDKTYFIDGDLNPWAVGKNNFEAMVDGTAQRPYVYRQLLPMAANWIDSRVPQRLKDRLFKMHDGKPLGHTLFDAPLASNKVYFLRYRLLYLEVFLFALLSVYSIYLLLTAARFPPLIAVLVSVATILLTPYLMSYYYDYPELAFMALVVWIALKCDWGWIVPVAALATWNKESFAIFILTLYPFFRLRSSRSGALLRVGVLALTCAAVYLPLRLRFQHNSGGSVEIHFMDQIRFLFDPVNLIIAHDATYRVVHLAPFTILPLLLIAWTVWRGWRNLPHSFRRHAQIAAALNIPLYLLFCWPGELRDLSLLYISLIMLVAVSVSEWGGSQQIEFKSI